MDLFISDLIAGNSPKTEIDSVARVINQNHVPTSLLLSTFEVFTLDLTHLCHYSTDVDRFPLRHILNRSDLLEVEGFYRCRHVVYYFDYPCILFKNYAEVILYLSELLIRQFDVSVREQVHFVLMDNFVKLLRRVFEKSSFNLSAV